MIAEPVPGVDGGESTTLQGRLGRRVREHRQALLDLAAAYGVTDVRVFGSVARGVETAQSDVDLLVHLPRDIGLLGVARLEQAFSEELDAPVEVVPDEGLKSGVFLEVQRDAVPL